MLIPNVSNQLHNSVWILYATSREKTKFNNQTTFYLLKADVYRAVSSLELISTFEYYTRHYISHAQSNYPIGPNINLWNEKTILSRYT